MSYVLHGEDCDAKSSLNVDRSALRLRRSVGKCDAVRLTDQCAARRDVGFDGLWTGVTLRPYRHSHPHYTYHQYYHPHYYGYYDTSELPMRELQLLWNDP
jgi:hypothetical protein